MTPKWRSCSLEKADSEEITIKVKHQHCKNFHCTINSGLEGLDRFVPVWERRCLCLGVQSSLLFLIWQLFYSLSEAIFTGGRYISTARCRLVFRDAATLPEITTKSLSRPNQTINVWDCCWNRVAFPVSCLSLWSYSSPSPRPFSRFNINSAFFKFTIGRPCSQLFK